MRLCLAFQQSIFASSLLARLVYSLAACHAFSMATGRSGRFLLLIRRSGRRTKMASRAVPVEVCSPKKTTVIDVKKKNERCWRDFLLSTSGWERERRICYYFGARFYWVCCCYTLCCREHLQMVIHFGLGTLDKQLSTTCPGEVHVMFFIQL